MRARELLLFSFAFSSVLSSAEILLSSKPSDTKPLKVSSSLECGRYGEGGATSSPDHGLQKRAIETGQKEVVGSPMNERNSIFEEDDQMAKRNRMGFTGMRGKKVVDPSCCDVTADKRVLRNYKELFGGKRAPLAFHGMRGKKSGDYEIDWLEPEFEYPEFTERRNEVFFEEEPAVNKRSPYSFQGMRGKKTSAYDFKRTMGFLGMRGKKGLETWSPDDYKRAPQSAFFGMKGKKAQSGFFGMRGKKPALASSYDIQGAPEPVSDNYQVLSFLEHLRGEGSEARQRRGSSWLYNDKKAKNAFFGVKGKKSTDENLLADLSPSAEN